MNNVYICTFTQYMSRSIKKSKAPDAIKKKLIAVCKANPDITKISELNKKIFEADIKVKNVGNLSTIKGFVNSANIFGYVDCDELNKNLKVPDTEQFAELIKLLSLYDKCIVERKKKTAASRTYSSIIQQGLWKQEQKIRTECVSLQKQNILFFEDNNWSWGWSRLHVRTIGANKKTKSISIDRITLPTQSKNLIVVDYIGNELSEGAVVLIAKKDILDLAKIIEINELGLLVKRSDAHNKFRLDANYQTGCKLTKEDGTITQIWSNLILADPVVVATKALMKDLNI